MKTKKSLNNIVWGIFSQIVIIGLGLLVPRIVLDNYGSDVNGFTSTVRQIFTYMALLEAGIGQSTLNSLYEPVAKDDKEKISSIMTASLKYYRKVTLLYGGLVLILAIVLPFAIQTDVDYLTAFGVVIFEGFSGVIGFYYLEAWKQLLSADGRYYVTQNITMISTILSYGIKIVLACLGVNIVVVQFAFLVLSLVQMLIYKIYCRKHYGWVDFKAKPNDEALKERYAFMVSQIATTIFSSTDMIVLSIFCSTKIASVYSIYSLIYNNLNNLLNAVYFGTVFLLGQTWKKSRRDYINLHDAFDGVSMWAITATMSVTYILTLPFVKLYTSGVNDVEYIHNSLPLLFATIQILSWSRYVSGNLTALSGHAKNVSIISAIEAAINLVLSVILVQQFGIIGTLFATVVAMPLKVIYCLIYTNRKILKRSIWKSLRILLVNYSLFIIVVLVENKMKLMISNFGEFLLYTVEIGFVIYPMYFITNYVANPALRMYVGKAYNRIRKRV